MNLSVYSPIYGSMVTNKTLFPLFAYSIDDVRSANPPDFTSIAVKSGNNMNSFSCSGFAGNYMHTDKTWPLYIVQRLAQRKHHYL